MLHSIKTFEGLTYLQASWDSNKTSFFNFCKTNGGERWQREEFVSHMYNNYIDTDVPITRRLYALDEDNLKLLIEYCYTIGSAGCNELIIDDGR